jgi:hypothetical protein
MDMNLNGEQMGGGFCPTHYKDHTLSQKWIKHKHGQYNSKVSECS